MASYLVWISLVRILTAENPDFLDVAVMGASEADCQQAVAEYQKDVVTWVATQHVENMFSELQCQLQGGFVYNVVACSTIPSFSPGGVRSSSPGTSCSYWNGSSCEVYTALANNQRLVTHTDCEPADATFTPRSRTTGGEMSVPR